MIDALCKSTTSILSSGLTTVIGFLALILMRFGIGADLGLALAKVVAISYFLDGKEYSADEIAGKSGKLKIGIKISDNKDSIDNFYDGFALQTSATLDTDKCSNITASGVTEANVGSDKQLTYTTMPSKGADIEITADVKDFEMTGIAINAVPLSLEIDIDDKELTDKVSEITDAITKIDDGAKSVNDGAGELKDSVKGEFKDGSVQLLEGAEDLKKGASELKGGTKELSDKTDGLDSEISDKIDDMIDSMTGSGVELKSFTSGKNTSVNSVQFVIKIDDIKVEEPEEPKTESKEELSFWQKLLKLFGIE